MLQRRGDGGNAIENELRLFFRGEFRSENPQKQFWEKEALMLNGMRGGAFWIPGGEKVSMDLLRRIWKEEVKPTIPKKRLPEIPAHWWFDLGIEGAAFADKVEREIHC